MLRRIFLRHGPGAIGSICVRRISGNTLEGSSTTRSSDSTILLNHLNKISTEQKEFLFGSAERNESTGSLFDAVNGIYADSMKQAQRTEIDLFIEKQREHYIQRLDEEVTEFMSEQSEVLKEFERHELDHFQNELLNDTKEFSDHRQKECRIRLEEDVRKYQFSVIPVRDSETKQLSNEKDGGNQDSSVDCNSLITAYVDRRHNFYEQLLNNEIVEFMHKRKLFYEELLQTRLSRKAENVKLFIEDFQAKREAYYKAKLERDAEWMSNSFQGHYEKCFLQCFARYAWLFYRQRMMHGADNEVKGITSITEMVNEIPLSVILDEYEKETMSDIGRDIFLKAARRLAIEKQ